MLSIPHSFPFDPRYGYTHEELRQLTAHETEPNDFIEFWQALYQKTLNTALNMERKPSAHSKPDWKIEEIYFDTLDKVRVGAWLVVPNSGIVKQLRVIGHGYGGRDAPGLAENELLAEAAHLFPVAPGFHLSASEDIPFNDAGKHVIHRIANKDTYVFRESAASLWSAASLLIELYPAAAHTLHYIGWSYGGGMGTIMLPWDKRYVCAELGQASFGHHPIRLQCRCVGSGEAVRRYHQDHPEVVEVLAYFDAATHAQHISQPVLFACCAFDPAVPPPGQYATALASPAMTVISEIEVGHYDIDYPGKLEQAQAHFERRLVFFKDHVPL